MSGRRIIENHNPIDYTCENSRFRTRIVHRDRLAPGSVSEVPLINSGDYTLWLEQVEDGQESNAELYWLMWYRNGVPTMPGSSVFGPDQLEELRRQLSRLPGP